MIRMYSYNYRDRVYQGDIFKNIEINVGIKIVDGVLDLKKIKFPYAVVMTQDCDLEQDFNNRETSDENQRNRIISILICPAFSSDDVKGGVHFEEINIKCKKLNSGLWNPIKKNKDKRYYFLDEGEFNVPYKGIKTIPDLVIDFKHFQTISRDEFYKLNDHYYVSINPLFREKVSDRFTHFLARIGLPEPKKDSGYCGTFCDTY